MNFVGSFEASPDQSTGPRSSLLSKLRQAPTPKRRAAR
jgi:hypothetical protein